MFGPEGREVRRKAFGEPDMRPFLLGDSVAEPLVRRLVRDQPFIHSTGSERTIGVEDCRGVLHAAEARGRLQMGELLVWKGTDKPGEEMDDLACLGEGTGNGRALLGRRVDELRNTPVGERKAACGLPKPVFSEG